MFALPPPPGAAWLTEAGCGSELAVLDWLLPGGEASGAVGLDEFHDTEALLPRDPSVPPALPVPVLRCLNPAHSAGCGVCLPPPQEGQDSLFMLLAPPDVKGAEGAAGPNG